MLSMCSQSVIVLGPIQYCCFKDTRIRSVKNSAILVFTVADIVPTQLQVALLEKRCQVIKSHPLSKYICNWFQLGILSCEVLMGKVPKAFLINYQI